MNVGTNPFLSKETEVSFERESEDGECTDTTSETSDKEFELDSSYEQDEDTIMPLKRKCLYPTTKAKLYAEYKVIQSGGNSEYGTLSELTLQFGVHRNYAAKLSKHNTYNSHRLKIILHHFTVMISIIYCLKGLVNQYQYILKLNHTSMVSHFLTIILFVIFSPFSGF